MRRLDRSRFDEPDEAHVGLNLPNLADLMLVFVTGLVAALAASTQTFAQRPLPDDLELSRELPSLPGAANAQGEGLEAIGRVFKDPETGKLYVIQ